MYIDLPDKETDKPIYRIISFERLVDLFKTEKNVLVKPKLWKDTFENFILRSRVRLKSGEIIRYNYHDRVYGQCWTIHSASDAMWRIYSPNKSGFRIRTTVRKLYESLGQVHTEYEGANNCIGKVQYLSDKKLMEFANSTFDDSGIIIEKLFRSLLIKRRAFIHEKEIRLLFHAWGDYACESDLHPYKIDPNSLITQIMVDPRISFEDFLSIETNIRNATGYNGPIKRSLLYNFPKDLILDVTNDFPLETKK